MECASRSARRACMRYHTAAGSAWGPYKRAAASARRGMAAAVAAAYDPAPVEMVERIASESAVVIFSLSTCCMCHAVKRLFRGMGVSPTVYELDEDPRGVDMERALVRLLGGAPAVPVVFIGGRLVGAMDHVMASHISGCLVPLLKEAGALWL